MHNIDLDELRHWLREAGKLAQQQFNHVTAWRKADHSWVTEVDQAIEQMLIERLALRYPNYGIIGEEQTSQDANAEYVWVLDPLDGTASFVAGLPMWGISLGLLHQGHPSFGMIELPLLGDCYWAEPGRPAKLNGTPIHVAAPREWEGEDWIAIPSNSHRRFTIDFPGKVRSLGSIAAEFCYVARGKALGALISRAALWDIAAGVAILQAAGGQIESLSGAQWDINTTITSSALNEPIIIGEASHITKLRRQIQQR
jgi:myo-inositol-1(or 4)-monophosphatase